MNKFQQEFFDLIGELGNITFGTASTALNMILGQEINISTPKVEIMSKENLLKSFPFPYVMAQVQYKEGLEGHNIFLLKPKDAAIIANLMMGGNGETDSEELGEMELSAIQEAMNQMMGNASTSMSNFLNKKIDISSPNVFHAKLNDDKILSEFIPDDNVIKITFDLTIGDLTKSDIMQIYNIPFAKQLASELLGI